MTKVYCVYYHDGEEWCLESGPVGFGIAQATLGFVLARGAVGLILPWIGAWDESAAVYGPESGVAEYRRSFAKKKIDAIAKMIEANPPDRPEPNFDTKKLAQTFWQKGVEFGMDFTVEPKLDD